MPRKSKKRDPVFKSRWERTIATELEKYKIPLQYEVDRLSYTIPESVHTYRPDFKISDTLYIEAKGIWDRKDREKILLIKQQYPKVTVCMAFQNANQKIYKRSKTTYAEWCEKNDIKWCHQGIRSEWLEKKNNNKKCQSNSIISNKKKTAP